MASPIAELLVNVGADVGDAVKGLNTVDASVTSLAGKVQPAGALFAGAGAAIGAGLAVGVKSAADLEQAVANISTIKPEIDTREVFAALNALSTKVPQTSAQLGDSLYNIFSSIETTQAGALKLLETFAKGAIGAQTDANTFGTAVLGVMNAYGLSVDDATHISDVFFNTVKSGVITGQELATSLGPVTQAAKNAGVGLDVLGGLIVGVTKEGGPAAQNVNNLANTLLKLNSPEAIKGFRELGIEVVDSEGKFRPILDVLTDARGRLGLLSEGARNSAISKIFGDVQARQGFQTLLSQLDTVKAAVAENGTQAGAAASAFNTMASTSASGASILQNSFTALLTTLGVALLPVLNAIGSGLAFLVGLFAQLPAPVQTFIALAGAFAAVALTLGGALLLLAPAIVAIGPALAAIGPLAAAAGVAIGAISLPLLAIGAAIGLLAVAWANNWGDIQGITQSAGAALVAFWNGSLLPALQGFGGFITGSVLPALAQFGGFLKENVFPLLQALGNLYLAGVQVEIAAFGAAWGALQPILAAVGGWIQTFILDPLGRFFELIGRITGLGEFFGALPKGIGDILGGIGAGAPANIQAATAQINAAAAATRSVATGTTTVNAPVTINATVTNEADEDRLIGKFAGVLNNVADRADVPLQFAGGALGGG